MFTLNQLKAVLLAAAKNDIRYYLNGVCVDGNQLIGTNGHLLIKFDIEDCGYKSLIIPRFEVEWFIKLMDAKRKRNRVNKKDNSVITILKDDADYYLYCEQLDVKQWFKPIDANYPDTQRVIPLGRQDMQAISFDCEYLKLIQTVGKMLYPHKRGHYAQLEFFGKGNGVKINYGEDDVCFVLMPVRDIVVFDKK